MLDTRGLVIGELAVRDHLISRDQLQDVVAVQQKGGFTAGKPDDLPPARREKYEKSGRNSLVLLKRLQ